MIQSGIAILIMAEISARRNSIPDMIVNLSIFVLRLADSRDWDDGGLARRSQHSYLAPYLHVGHFPVNLSIRRAYPSVMPESSSADAPAARVSSSTDSSDSQVRKSGESGVNKYTTRRSSALTNRDDFAGAEERTTFDRLIRIENSILSFDNRDCIFKFNFAHASVLLFATHVKAPEWSLQGFRNSIPS